MQDSVSKAIHVAIYYLMVTGDIGIEAFLVEVFYNIIINPGIKNQPTNLPHPPQALFTLLYIKLLLSLESKVRVIHYTIGLYGLFMLIPIAE